MNVLALPVGGRPDVSTHLDPSGVPVILDIN